MPREEMAGKSAKITKKVLDSQVYQEAKWIFTYVSSGNEPDTFAIMEDAFRTGKRVLVPVCIGKGHMVAQEIDGIACLRPAKFGIPEPEYDQARVILPREIELAIIPGLAFGEDGTRMGFGAGFYDRFLQQAEGAYKLALAYEWQFVDKLPAEKHDVCMDAIATEQRLLAIKNRE